MTRHRRKTKKPECTEQKRGWTHLSCVKFTVVRKRSLSDGSNVLDVLVAVATSRVVGRPHGLSVGRIVASTETLLLAVVDDRNAAGNKGWKKNDALALCRSTPASKHTQRTNGMCRRFGEASDPGQLTPFEADRANRGSCRGQSDP